MVDTAHAPLLSEDERPSVEVLNPGGAGGIVFVCEHASRVLPRSLGDLGLSDAVRAGHWAWDIGALDVARGMSAAFDAPLVAGRISRLAYDCNRPPSSPTAIVETAEYDPVPGNRGLTPDQRAQRVAEVYAPFQAELSRTLDAHPGAVLVTIHSFTPINFGMRREVELGFLHDDDPRLALAMLAAAGEAPRYDTRLNEPYDAGDGVTHTLREHALPRGLVNAMIELRSDLINTPATAAEAAGYLSGLLKAALVEVAL